MKPAPFVHHSPRTLDEAVAVLGDVGHDGKVLAGGQSLIPVLNMRLAQPAHLVDINRVAGLDTVTVTDTSVRVGAIVRHAQLEKHDGAYAVLPLLRQALRNVAHPAIRNRGTTVGSIAHADAAGEMPSIAVLTDAVIEAIGPRGRREIAAREFFEGPLQTLLEADEILEAVRFGRFAPGTRTAFLESARRHGDYALAGLGVAVDVEGDGPDAVVRGARAAYVSVTDIPVVLDLSEAVAGQRVSSASWDGVEELVQAGIAPEADIHASSDYRRALAVELTRRALTTAATTTEPATTTTEGHA
ncbi:xanthine dehydrogenase family protein subunit M [Knoellia locipacati]|uniref:Carbon monoxide dehydrogenase n=1 Tax=Knoellia locipacati TaxID=882824 RepID=A0A512SWU5_9MICO|nr:FAD binding domain-containing protein [Knoellia locipacati]GEQ12430.1 carbon monoxide dehydrogenase [Knoellia locipacati]